MTEPNWPTAAIAIAALAFSAIVFAVAIWRSE
jgi:hypothetical protein